MSKFVLFVPLYYNDGRKVPKKVILDFEDRLYVLGGGFADKGTFRGICPFCGTRRRLEREPYAGSGG
ncbi:MAG: hypothetical protein V3V75_01275, partial [Thermoguttaceae bacterium]